VNVVKVWRSLVAMEPIRLDDLPSEVWASLERRAQAQGVTPSAYVLDLVLRDLAAMTSWSAWLTELTQDESVMSVDATAALTEARAERSEQLGAVVSGDQR
jgi:hypothetical protein